LTGVEAKQEPELYVWGNLISGDVVNHWNRLGEAQREIEKGKQHVTEPDVILRVAGKAIVLVEAKLRSANSWLPQHRIEEYLQRYRARSPATDPLDRIWIRKQNEKTIFGQLLRNVIFAHWLAAEDEQQFVVNLVRQVDASNIVELFKKHLRPGKVSFQRVTWEMLYQLSLLKKPEADELRRYFNEKTVCLKKAFQT
jgi:hypothetical protein